MHRRVLSPLALALTLALAACGGAPTPQAAPPAAVTPPAPGGSLVTLHIAPDTNREALAGALGAAALLSFQPEAGTAIAALPPAAGTLRVAGLSAFGVSSARLAALDAQVQAVEPDQKVAVLGGVETMGALTWAGGLTTWAGGLTTWAGGLSGMDAASQSAFNLYMARIGLPLAVQKTLTNQGAGIKIAVVDTGIDLQHPFLKAQISTTQGWDFVNNDAVPQEVKPVSGAGKYGHGTAVAGVVLAVAPQATLLPYRVLGPDGSGDVSRVVLAIDRAVADGARVINLSLGLDTDSAALNASVRSALARGVVVVASAGNAGKEGLVYPAGYVNTAGISATSGLINVGSAEMDGRKSSFSNYAANLLMSAPGNKVVTAYPGARLAAATGTSFAAPAVAGAVALAIAKGNRSMGMLTGDLTATATRSADPTYQAKAGNLLNVARYVTIR